MNHKQDEFKNYKIIFEIFIKLNRKLFYVIRRQYITK